MKTLVAIGALVALALVLFVAARPVVRSEIEERLRAEGIAVAQGRIDPFHLAYVGKDVRWVDEGRVVGTASRLRVALDAERLLAFDLAIRVAVENPRIDVPRQKGPGVDWRAIQQWVDEARPLQLTHARLTGGRIAAPVHGRTLRLRDVDFEARDLVPSRRVAREEALPSSFEGSAVIETGGRFEMKGALAPTAERLRLELNLVAQNINLQPIHAEAAGLRLRGLVDFTADLSAEGGRLEGVVNAHYENLEIEGDGPFADVLEEGLKAFGLTPKDLYEPRDAEPQRVSRRLEVATPFEGIAKALEYALRLALVDGLPLPDEVKSMLAPSDPRASATP